ncbi:MAG: hypothetical protein IJO63_04965 [Bacilli bacterium]|nr:hypothetical protein [Bacilli bacterium]
MAYITNFEPIIIDDVNYDYLSGIEQKVKSGAALTEEETSFFLDNLGYFTRVKLNPEMIYFHNKCDTAQAMEYHYLKDLGLEPIPSMTQFAITNHIIGHSFLVVKLLVEDQERLYLLDPTYIQFFSQEDCSMQKFYVSALSPDTILATPDPGFFIREKQKGMAKFLLDHGYILLTPEVARMYGDSFFNTKVGVSKSNWRFQTIPGEVYINAFTKPNCPISKTKEELENEGLRVAPVEEMLLQRQKSHDI